MVYFITGASGFFGNAFLKEFFKKHTHDYVKVLIHKNDISNPLQHGEYVYGSILEKEQLASFLHGVDVVVHFAGVTHSQNVQKYFDVNAKGTRNIIEAAQKVFLKNFVYISSRAIQDECGEYAASKKEAEHLLQQSGLPYTILRFSELYGNNSTEGLDKLVTIIKKFPLIPFPWHPHIRLAPLLLKDAIELVGKVAELDCGLNKTYIIAGPTSYSLYQVLKIICKTLGVKRLVVPIPVSLLKLFIYSSSLLHKQLIYPDQIKRLICIKQDTIRSAVQDFNFDPLPFEVGITHALTNMNQEYI